MESIKNSIMNQSQLARLFNENKAREKLEKGRIEKLRVKNKKIANNI